MRLVAAILVIAFNSGCYVHGRQDDATRRLLYAQTDLHTFAAKLRDFEAYNHRLPTNEEGLGILVQKPGGVGELPWVQLMDALPLDPWGHPYHYKLSVEPHKGYEVSSFGPDGVESADDLRFP